MRETPRRMAAAYLEMLTPREFDLTTFPNDEGYDELVLARSIPVRSVCEHHMLPFLGVAHVGYLPGERILGLSKLARVVELFCQTTPGQERLTARLRDWLQDTLDPHGVGVVIEAEHLCMTVRGVRADGTRTVTSALLGRLRDDPRSRAEFLALTIPPTRGCAMKRDVRHRRRRSRRREGCGDAARGGVRRARRAGRRRGRATVRAATAVQGLPRRERAARVRVRPRTGGTPSTTWSCSSEHARHGDGPGRAGATTRRRQRRQLRQAAAHHRFVAAQGEHSGRRPRGRPLPAPARATARR